MTTLQDSLVSSSARKLSVRKRPDLSARQQQYLGRSYWVVKEPVGLNYFRFQDEEYAILQMIDGRTSLDEIKERFEADFPPQKITLEELQQFIGMLHRSGLVIADVPGQGQQLRKRRDQRRRQELLGAWTNVLCIRFKGFDPERILNRIYPYVRWFFSAPVMALCLIGMLSALTLVVVQFDDFRSKLPSFYQFFGPANVFWLAVTLAVSKVLHEFGHGLTCKHFGGECHEMGVMILVLTPCLYCNVSDSWMLPNKWHRAAIGAAGIFVEVLLASICTFIWWFTEPGLLNNICLNLVFIASVSTIIFNANPLLRYDGYYVLSDLVEIPNLRQKATSILSRKLGQWLLGLEPSEDPFLPQRNQVLFAVYSVAAAMYRWFVLASILYFMFKVFEPYGLQIIGQGIIVMSLYGLVVMPLYKLGRFFYVPGRWNQVKKPRMYTSLGVLSLVILAILLVPLPHSVFCTLEIQARDASPVYVTQAGMVQRVDGFDIVVPGQPVEKDEPLVQLANLDLELAVAALVGERDKYQTKLKSLRRLRLYDEQAALEIPQIEEELKTFQAQLEQKEADLARLLLVAPVAGIVLPPPHRPRREDPDGRLSSWSGTPLDPKNQGCFLQEGDLFCQVGEPERMEAVLVIDQGDIELVRKRFDRGDPVHVDIKLNELPYRTLRSTIADIGPGEMKISSQRLSTKTGGELATKTDASGLERPQSTSYQANVPLDDAEGILRLGLRGRAKIHTDPQTLARRLWRLISQTINFM